MKSIIEKQDDIKKIDNIKRINELVFNVNEIITWTYLFMRLYIINMFKYFLIKWYFKSFNSISIYFNKFDLLIF